MRPARLLSLWLCAFGFVTLIHAGLTHATHPGDVTAAVGLTVVGAAWIAVGAYRILRPGAEDWPDARGSWLYVGAIVLVGYAAFVAYVAVA
ncbi:hypothetical protein [Halovivax sp.]|uniref:hypothetical protein n=1 Tax=Halovivax sp. TaxID=1935978 RepID=UPI0025C272C8|nr:hypothetical protein [Halovivax sp.]